MIYWRQFLLPYDQAVDELKVKLKALIAEHRKRSEYSPIEFVVGRVKSVPSIMEKAKKLEYSHDEIREKMEDIAGLRIMCQFEDDIYKVIEHMKLRHGKDLEIVYEKNYIKNQKESGYRSYHMIIKYPVVTTRGLEEVLVEIQIRTLAMNFWATIEHSLNYKYRENMPEEIALRLRKSAEIAYQLDKEMLEIREEVVNAQELFTMKSNTTTRAIYYMNIIEKIGEKDVAEVYRKKFYDITESLDENREQLLQNLSEELRIIVDKKYALED